MIDVDELLEELETADVGDTIESPPNRPLRLDEAGFRGLVVVHPWRDRDDDGSVDWKRRIVAFDQEVGLD